MEHYLVLLRQLSVITGSLEEGEKRVLSGNKM